MRIKICLPENDAFRLLLAFKQGYLSPLEVGQGSDVDSIKYKIRAITADFDNAYAESVEESGAVDELAWKALDNAIFLKSDTSALRRKHRSA
jgi:hypothetical protein